MSSFVTQTGDSVQRAAEALRDGALVVLPMETVYGVAASVAHPTAVDRLRALKGAAVDQPMTVHVADLEAAAPFLREAPRWLGRVVGKLLPGPVTLRLPIDDPAAMLAAAGLPEDAKSRVWGGGYVRLRCPTHGRCREALAGVGVPVVATGAAVAGQRLPIDAPHAAAALDGRVDYVLDGGRSRHGRPSTVVRIGRVGASEPFHVERVGVWDARYVQKLMRWTVLFVCSGNTCRSPMAAGLARQVLAEREQTPVDALETRGITVLSAGTGAGSGMPASPEAVDIMAGSGIDIASHRSRPLTRELINQADVIYTMTEAHRQAVLAAAPDAAGKTHRLDDQQDISDPIGAGPDVYQQTATQIREALARRLKE